MAAVEKVDPFVLQSWGQFLLPVFGMKQDSIHPLTGRWVREQTRTFHKMNVVFPSVINIFQ